MEKMPQNGKAALKKNTRFGVPCETTGVKKKNIRSRSDVFFVHPLTYGLLKLQDLHFGRDSLGWPVFTTILGGLETSPEKYSKGSLVGGWTNPSEKYYVVKLGSSSLIFGVIRKNIWNHHLVVGGSWPINQP